MAYWSFIQRFFFRSARYALRFETLRGNLKRFGFKCPTVHRPSVCPMCCIEHTLYHYYTTLGGGPICNFLRLFSSISSLPLTTLLQLILGLVDYFKNNWGQTKELPISFYWFWVYFNYFEHCKVSVISLSIFRFSQLSTHSIMFTYCFWPKCMQPFQTGATVTVKVKAGLEFSNPSKQF